MALSSTIPSIPVDTNHAAKAIYSRDNFFLVVGDRLVELLRGIDLDGMQATKMLSRRENPSLAMATIFQFIEMLPDPQAVEATRARVDMKYALHLSMNYPGVASNALCQYRQRTLREPSRLQDLQLILDRLTDAGLLMGHQDQMVAAAEVLEEVCSLTRFERILQAMESAIGSLATYHPEWLQKITLPHWYTRFRIFNASHPLPLERVKRTALAEAIGADADYLLNCYARDAQPSWAKIQEVQALYQIRLEQFERLPTCESKLMERCPFCGELPDGPASVRLERAGI